MTSGNTTGRHATLLRRALRVALIIVVVIVCLITGFIGMLQFDPFGTWVARRAVSAFIATDALDVTIDRVSGSWIRSLKVAGLRVVTDAGDTVVSVDTLLARYRLLPLLRHTIDVRAIRVISPLVRTERRADGSIGIEGWPAAPEPVSPTDSQPAGWQIGIRALDVINASGLMTTPNDSVVRIPVANSGTEPVADEVVLGWSRVNVALHDLAIGTDVSVVVDSAVGRLDVPTLPQDAGVGPLDFMLRARLSDRNLDITTLDMTGPNTQVVGVGNLVLPDSSNTAMTVDFLLDVDSLPLALVHAALGNPPDAAARLSAHFSIGGTTDLLTADIDVASSDGGGVTGSAALSPTATGPVHYRADLALSSLDPGFLTGDTALAGRVDGRVDVDLEGPELSRLSGRAGLTFDRFRIGPTALRSIRFESNWDAGEATMDVALRGDDITADIGGTVRPLDAESRYDLGGPFRLGIAGDSAEVATVAGRLTVTGNGFAPATASAQLDVGLSEIAVLGARLESATIAAHIDSGRVAWSVGARATDAGRLDGHGSATLDGPISFNVERASIRDLDVAAFLGDTVPSRLDADITASGTMGALDEMQSDMRLTVRGGRFGSLVIDTALVNATVARSRLAATGRAVANGGRVDFEIGAQPFATVPAWDLTRVRFAGINAGVLMPDTILSTDLDFTVTGTGQGVSLGQMVVDLTVQFDSSRINRQNVTGGTASLGLRDSRTDIQVDLAFADSGGIQLDLSGLPFAERPTFTIRNAVFTALDPFALGGLAGGSASLTGDATATTEGFQPSTMVSDGSLRLSASRFNGESIREGNVEFHIDAGTLTADTDIAFGAGQLDAHAQLSFSETALQYEILGSLQSGQPGRLAGVDSLGGWVDATIAIDGQGTSLASMTTHIRASADSMLIGEMQVDTLRLAVLIDRGVASLDTLTIRSNFMDLTGSGGMPVSDSARGTRSDLVVEATIKSLAPVQRWFGDRIVAIGSGTLNMAVTGPSDSLRFRADAAVSAMQLGGTRLIGLESRIDGILSPGLRLLSAGGDVRLDRLSLGTLDVRGSNVNGDWNGEELTLTGDAILDDRREVGFAMGLDLRPDSARARFDRLDVRVDSDQWQLAGTPTISWVNGIRVDSLSLRAGDQAITINGVLDVAAESDLTARFEQLRLGGIADLLGYSDLDGTATASFDVHGPAADPRITGGLDARLQWRNGQSSAVAASMSYDSLRLELDGRIAPDGGGTLTVTGGLPIDLALTRSAEGDTTKLTASAAGTVGLVISADSFNVQWVEPFLDPATARGLRGQVQIDARVGGTQADPVLSGFISLTRGGLTLPSLGVTYDNAVMRVTLDDNVARIDTASARNGAGSIVLSGTIAVPELSLGQFDIDARLDQFRAIYNDAFRVTMSGTTRLSGTTREPRLEGQVQLVRTDVYLTSAASGASVRPVELTESQIRELEDYFGMTVVRQARDPSALFDALAIDLAVSMDRDTWVRQRANPTMTIQLTGDVRVTKEPADSLRYDGSVEAIPQRSYVEQFGRRFAIERANIELQGLASTARVDVRATYRVPSPRDPAEAEVTITLDIAGTLEDLSLLLGSEPALENADIVSYLATGRPAATSLDFQGGSGAGGLGSIGSEYALGQVTNLVEGLAAEGIGLDVIDIQPDGLRGAMIIAGRYVTPLVYVGFKQPIGRDPDVAGTSSQAQSTQVEVEYQALRWLLLNMQASNSAVSLLFRYRHAY